ncbi:MAG: hypothetical protein RTU30_09640 [Candidatus Thorarchaeota archaeon]
MQKSRQIQTLICLVILVLPFFGLIIDLQTDKPIVCVVMSEENDINIELALSTLRQELDSADVRIIVRTIDQWDVIPQSPIALVFIGHGQPDGLESQDGIIPWNELYDEIAALNTERSIVLACDSPSDIESGIYGFVGQIDAEAGAILAAWQVRQVIDKHPMDGIQGQRVLESQVRMLHPLGKYVYFVNGYFGDDREYADMIEKIGLDLLSIYDGFRFFDYSDDYLTLTNDEIHSLEISDYAKNFADKILQNHTSGDRIDIVAHSLGGIITREMLRLRRTVLQTFDIDIEKVITLGTPHYGSYSSDEFTASMMDFFQELFGSEGWYSPVFLQLYPTSSFMQTLNEDPAIYSAGIEWYTVAGYDPVISELFSVILGGSNDGAVAEWSAHLDFSEQVTIYGISHGSLIKEPVNLLTYAYIDTWLGGALDSDEDGLLDFIEDDLYFTDPHDPDTDGDGMPDGWEVQYVILDPLGYEPDGAHDPDGLTDLEEYLLGTNPIDCDTDNDGLWDGTEVAISHTNPLCTDTDSDGISDWDEVYDVFHYDTNPLLSDTDSDGFSDWEEINKEYGYATNPTLYDTDSDGISDWDEIYQTSGYATDPTMSDSDLDGLGDNEEIVPHGTSPTDWDSDDDELSDGYEIDIGTYPMDWDSDDDTLKDGHEITTDPLNPDCDGDGLLDGIEVHDHHTSPTLFDTDGDGCPDGWEVINGIDPNDPNTGRLDYEPDGLTNLEEYQYMTCPWVSDSDGDGLMDEEEMFTYFTDPNDPDCDDDGIPDGWEVDNDLLPGDASDAQLDLEPDGLTNLEEYQYMTDPHVSDCDDDGIPDGWEVDNGFLPLDSSDAQDDDDGDGLNNLGEYQNQTDPHDPDCDDDGLNDYLEVSVEYTDPWDSDHDDDGLLDGVEAADDRIEPLLWSTDADILSDGQEIAWGYEPNNSNDPIPASELISNAWSKSSTGFARANDYDAVEYVKVYAKYKNSYGVWTSYYHVGTDYTPLYYDDYYVSWTIPSGYVQMKVYVKAYDDADHYLGSDITYLTISSGGGGSDPPPL